MRPMLFFFLAGILACQDVSAQKSTTCNCGWVNKGRIVGGRETKKQEFPWMAVLYEVEIKTVGCGASIVTRNHAITAAHCAYLQNYNIVLWVGVHNLQNPDEGTRVPVAGIIRNPEFDESNYSNDIAVVITETPIPFSATIGPLCLPTGPINLDHQRIKAIGWGQEGYTLGQSQVLKSVDLTVMPHDECKRDHWPILVEPKKQICAIDGAQGVCMGDSGGPTVWMDPEIRRFVLVGIPSYVRNCTFPPPSVFAEVGAFIPWVQKIIQETKPDKTCNKV